MLSFVKKTVLAHRIRKAVHPLNRTVQNALEMYTEMFRIIFKAEGAVITSTLEIVGQHADEIATALISLEPVFKAFKEANLLESFKKDLQSMEDQLEHKLEPINEACDEIKEIFDAKEEEEKQE